jgi:hypothetical protein
MFTPLHHNLGPLVARPAAFTPDRLTGLRLWLKADSLAGLADGDPVGTWADASGSGNDLSAGGAARPALRTSVLNGAPVVRFDGFAHAMTRATFAGLSAAAQAFTLLLVRKQTTVAGFSTPWSFYGAGDVYGHAPYNGNASFYSPRPDVRTDPGVNAADFYVLSWTENGADCRLHRGGLAVATYTGGSTPSFSGGRSFSLFAYQGSSAFVAGDVAEVLMYDSALGDDDRRGVERYLGGKYGIALA